MGGGGGGGGNFVVPNIKKMKSLFSFGAIVIALAISSCKKESITHPISSMTVQNEEHSSPAERGVEMACVIYGKAGTKCVSGANGKCKLYPCRPIPGQTSIIPTMTEIEVMATNHAQELVDLQLIEPADFQESKNVAMQSLIAYYY